MAIEIRVPRLGWNMEEGVFHGWLKKDGDPIRPGDPLFTLEGDKAVQDVEATDAGILHIPADCPKNGDPVLVGVLLGHLAEAGETVAVRPVVMEKPKASPLPQRAGQAISPRARRLARQAGIAFDGIQGGGRTGRIREVDVRAAIEARGVTVTESAPLTASRRAIAAKMMASLKATAPVTLTTTADATNLVALREQFRATEDVVPGYTDLIVKLAAVALRSHPDLNARWDGETIVTSKDIHIGLAVDTEAGLLVPVLRDVPSLGVRQLAVRSRELSERARARKLTANEMQGGTFTVSNLGMYGVDAFTPILNYPECAILGLGRIRRVPAVVGELIVPRDQMTLSLTFDHRAVDGAPAARFLDHVRKCIENPGPALMT